jgi:nitrate/TMAO reductase-like tetraheme cytochrome c subunit
MRNLLAALTRNTMSLLGTALVLVSGILFVTLLGIELLGAEGHPYIGIITYLILPGVLFLGVVLMVWGVRRERRRTPESVFPIIDLNLDSTRKRLMVFIFVFVVSVVVLAIGSFKGVEFMESNAFCGETCHNVMAPEYTAYQRSPHARVRCVECHIGPGTSWFVKSKLNGAWQLVSTALDLYSRPIPTPVHNLRPSKATCEQCHWPEKFHGVVPRMITRYSDDEGNTALKTILLLKVGGHDLSESKGIHWHMDPGVQIRYRADGKRETMFEVELSLADGTVKRYTNGETDPEGSSTWRVMDCVDCHNRPTHIYYSAEESVDLALQREFLPADLPYIRREALKAMRTEYASHDEARGGIAAAVNEFYRTAYPELAVARAADIEAVGHVLAGFYRSNVFPSMNIGWNTYPDHSGHEKSPGCYRCHAGEHSTEDGETIADDCSVCHTIVAWEEASPEILELIPAD